jgi:hypothetical protein
MQKPSQIRANDAKLFFINGGHGKARKILQTVPRKQLLVSIEVLFIKIYQFCFS